MIGFVGAINAQVAVGKSTVNGDGLLDFAAESIYPDKKGLILPKVDAIASTSVSGTIYLNVSGQVEYLDKDKIVVSMSKSANGFLTGLPVNLNGTGKGVVITDDSITSLAPGILVLDSNNKALILPKVTNPETTIGSPSPGMMVYDLDSNSIAVYNGEKWSFFN